MTPAEELMEAYADQYRTYIVSEDDEGIHDLILSPHTFNSRWIIDTIRDIGGIHPGMWAWVDAARFPLFFDIPWRRRYDE
jgi:hypothetical protein